METRSLKSLLSNVRRTLRAQGVAGLPDEHLLEAFVACGDEAAVAELMRRHGAMVMAVCRRVLQNSHDAEDAFQATFLVLIRKASQVHPPSMVANWLHGVAYRAALQARAARARRTRRERQVRKLPEIATFPPEPCDDVRRLIDQELGRLAEKHRLPVILCDLEGQSIKDAARQLGWPQGTVAGRLARARKLLAQRLARRGLTVPSRTVASIIAAETAAATVPAALIDWTGRAVVASLAGSAAVPISAKVTTITQGVLKYMLWTKMKRAAVVPLVLAVLGSGVWTTAALFSTPPAEQNQTPPSDATTPPVRANTPAAKDGRSEKFFFTRMYLFDRGVAKPGIDFVQVPDPDGKKTKREMVWKKSFHLINLRDGQQLNKFDIATQRAWGIEVGKGRVGFGYETGVNCDLMVRQGTPGKATGQTRGTEDVALSFCLHKRDVENPDSEDIAVRGSSIQVFRKIKLGAAERIVLEKDVQGQPTSWLEVTIVPDDGTHPARLRLRADAPAPAPTPAKPRPIVPKFNPVALPKDSRGQPYAAGMEGVWTVTRIEADGQSLGAQAIDKFGKTMWCTQGRLITPGRGLFDLGWVMPFELDTSTTPKRIALRAKGPSGPLRFNGIYRLDDTDLTICLNDSGEDPTFPTEFKTKKGSPFVIFTCQWRGPGP